MCVTASNSNPEVRGFYINQLYSFTVSPGELVSAYLAGFGNELAAKEFHNSKLGLPYLGEGAQITDDMIEQVIANHTMQDPRPRFAGERFITMGVDQGKMCSVVICEWIPTGRPSRDISALYVCRVVWAGRFSDQEIWKRLAELMVEWQVLYCVLDADPEINLARTFCRRFDGFAAVCRYRGQKNSREITKSDEDTGAPMLTVDRTNWIDAALGRFKTGRIQLPRDVTEEFKLHVKSLVRTYKREKEEEKDKETTAYAIYVNVDEDHFAHALTYAELALQFAPQQSSGSVGKVI